MNSALAFAGRHGPLLLFFGVLIGFMFPVRVVVAPWLGGLSLVEAYLAASVFPIFMLPLLTKMLMARRPAPLASEVASSMSRVLAS